jgi:hypothetical protein
MEQWWNNTGRWKCKCWERRLVCHKFHIGLGLNQSLCDERMATDRLSHGMVLSVRHGPLLQHLQLTVARAAHTWAGSCVQFLRLKLPCRTTYNRDYHSSCTDSDDGLTGADVVDALSTEREVGDLSLGLVFTLDEE